MEIPHRLLLAQFNVLATLLAAAVLTACGGGADSSSGTPAPPAPTASQLSIRVNPFGTRLGAALATQPIVEVQDASGRLFTTGSVAVTAAIATGGGTLSGTTTVNSVAGVATFTDLSISGSAGDRTLVFSAPGLASVHSPTFTLAASTPATLRVVTPPPSTAQATLALSPQPVVVVLDAAGNPITTPTTVTASIVSGTATIFAGSTATTQGDGTATFSGLTLGALNGNVGAASLRFAASTTAFADNAVTLGCFLQPITVGQTISAKLTTADCAFTGFTSYYKQYSFSVAATTAVELTETGALQAYPHFQSQVSSWNWGFISGTAGQGEAIKGLLPAGQYRVAASAANIGEVGDFTLSLATAGMDVGCEDVIAFGTLSLTQQLQTTDCKFAGTSQFYDDFAVGLAPGASVTATVSGSSFTPFVGVLIDTSYAAFQNGSNTATTTYQNNGATGILVDVIVSSTTSSALRTGAYALALTVTTPAGTTAAPNRAAGRRMPLARAAHRASVRRPPM